MLDKTIRRRCGRCIIEADLRILISGYSDSFVGYGDSFLYVLF